MSSRPSSVCLPQRGSCARARQHRQEQACHAPPRPWSRPGTADGQEVRIGGGPTVVRDFLAAGLIDHLHVVQVPIVLGRGVRLWDGLESLEDGDDVEAVSTPSGVTHLTFSREAGSGGH